MTGLIVSRLGQWALWMGIRESISVWHFGLCFLRRILTVVLSPYKSGFSKFSLLVDTLFAANDTSHGL
jgi:hypothetical protein